MLTEAIVDAAITDPNDTIDNVEILSVITKPLANLIVQLDSKTLNAYAVNATLAASQNLTLIKHKCKNSEGQTINCKLIKLVFGLK